MSSTKSSQWFEESFERLAPLLRDLHIYGGELSGPVRIKTPKGISGIIGLRIAKKLGVPTNNVDHTLKINISHEDNTLNWDRCFDDSNFFYSKFVPVGTMSKGYWLENSGAIQLTLTVEIKDGGWHWKTLKAKFKGVSIPLWLFPKVNAYKTIENNAYRFYVGISLPFFGEVLSYSGLLKVVGGKR